MDEIAIFPFRGSLGSRINGYIVISVQMTKKVVTPSLLLR